jgi:V8-like Glu-specific endopeptidase
LTRWGSAAAGLLLLAACAATPPVAPAIIPPPPPQVLPWMASVGGLHIRDDQSSRPVCTATLVATNLILTAAHCIYDATGNAVAQSLVFVPNEGAQPTFRGLAVLAVHASGGQVLQGHIDAEKSVMDWAILRIEPAPPGLQPIVVNAMRWSDIETRLAAGDRFVSSGYGEPGQPVLTRHGNCRPVDGAWYNRFVDDGLLASDCRVQLGDSGGPMVMLDIAGRPHLIAVISGIGWPNSDRPLGIGVDSKSFVNYINSLNVSMQLPGDLPATTATSPLD